MTPAPPSVIPLADPDDPRAEPYRCVRERDLRGRAGRFVIEGEVVLRTAVRLGRYPIESVLVGEGRLGALSDTLAALPPGVPVYAAARPVLDAVAGFPLHRGVLAIGRSAGLDADAGALLAALPPRALVLAASGIANHDNMGGLFRNAAAFGVGLVLLDGACCDPLYRKSLRVSAGAALVVPYARGGDIEALCAGLDAHGVTVLATSPRGAEPLRAVTREPRMAVLVGAEGPGLDRSVLARRRTVRLDMAGGFDSLNVATAAAIVLHHLSEGDEPWEGPQGQRVGPRLAGERTSPSDS